MTSGDVPWPGTEEWWGHSGFLLAAGSDAGGLAHLRAFHSLFPQRVHLWTPTGRIGFSPSEGMAGLRAEMPEAQAAIVSTGWQSTFEQEASAEALALGIPLYIVLDRWNNYAERLHWLPAAALVTLVSTDPFALAICEDTFPSRRAVLWPNVYEASLKSEVDTHQANHASRAKGILLLGEPVERNLTSAAGQPEELLGGSLRWLPEADDFQEPRVIIRPHPSESPRKYDAIAHEIRAAGVPVEMSQRSLAGDLAEAHTAVGVHTYALYLAARLGIRAYSISERAGLVSQFPPGCGVKTL